MRNFVLHDSVGSVDRQEFFLRQARVIGEMRDEVQMSREQRSTRQTRRR